MQHFAKDDGMNIFRLPVGWQYLVNGKLGGTLDAGNFGRYQSLVQACLGTGAYCMLDVSLFIYLFIFPLSYLSRTIFYFFYLCYCFPFCFIRYLSSLLF